MAEVAVRGVAARPPLTPDSYRQRLENSPRARAIKRGAILCVRGCDVGGDPERHILNEEKARPDAAQLYIGTILVTRADFRSFSADCLQVH